MFKRSSQMQIPQKKPCNNSMCGYFFSFLVKVEKFSSVPCQFNVLNKVWVMGTQMIENEFKIMNLNI